LSASQCGAYGVPYEQIVRIKTRFSGGTNPKLCPHPSRAKWRSDFIVNLRKKCQNLSTDQWLLDILLSGIESCMTQTPFDSSEFPSEYQILIQKQTAIGWVHLFQGRLTNSWQRMQQYHYSGLRPVKGQDGAFWSRSILAHMFLEWLLLWDACNKSVHGNDSCHVPRPSTTRLLESSKFYTPTATKFFSAIDPFIMTVSNYTESNRPSPSASA
jgi:hypothetical protein